VRDSYHTGICGPDYVNQIEVIILDDESLWAWNRFSGWSDWYARRNLTIAGLITAALAGLTLVFGNRWDWSEERL